jgi:hypothetical protein
MIEIIISKKKIEFLDAVFSIGKASFNKFFFL